MIILVLQFNFKYQLLNNFLVHTTRQTIPYHFSYVKLKLLKKTSLCGPN